MSWTAKNPKRKQLIFHGTLLTADYHSEKKIK